MEPHAKVLLVNHVTWQKFAQSLSIVLENPHSHHYLFKMSSVSSDIFQPRNFHVTKVLRGLVISLEMQNYHLPYRRTASCYIPLVDASEAQIGKSLNRISSNYDTRIEVGNCYAPMDTPTPLRSQLPPIFSSVLNLVLTTVYPKKPSSAPRSSSSASQAQCRPDPKSRDTYAHLLSQDEAEGRTREACHYDWAKGAVLVGQGSVPGGASVALASH